jgi:two-component system OmpR family response regulator
LTAEGWSVDWALDLKSAMDAVLADTYCLVLLDVHLPDGSGLELLRRFGNYLGPAPVIILSAYDQLSDRIEGLRIGATDYLVKPFNLAEVSLRIHKALSVAATEPKAMAVSNRTSLLR